MSRVGAKKVIVIGAAAMVALSSLSSGLFAQAPVPVPGMPAPSPAAVPAASQPAAPVPFMTARTPFRDTFLFSAAELAAIQKAGEGAVSGTAMLDAQNQVHIPQKRVIALAGVSYRSASDWVLWINGHMVTPKNLLPEIVDVVVEKDKVRLKWFDIGLNGIINITLRPHQTYDIVTGVLLPG